MTNRNTQTAAIIAEELARSGVTDVCAAPGSRHTPLMLAFAQHPRLRVTSHLDERSAAFFALGLAIMQGRPVVLVCTSGSAGANMFPAIIEAHQSRVPLIVLTADRPQELRGSGANQTIDQIKLFGDFVLDFVDAPLPEANPPAVALRHLRTMINRAVAKANGLRRGVVHINLPYRKPLEPTPVADDVAQIPSLAAARADETPFASFLPARLAVDERQVTLVRSLLRSANNALIVCGPRCPSGDFPQTVTALGQALNVPVIADALSGVRFGQPDVISAYETFLNPAPQDWPTPDVILRFGDVPTSKWLNDYLAGVPARAIIQIAAHGEWADDTHRLTHHIQTDETAFCKALIAEPLRLSGDLTERLNAYEQTTRRTLTARLAEGAFTEASAVYTTFDHLPAGTVLFAGNSLSVRHVDQFGFASPTPVTVLANRGASGIDGNISTALGAGLARPESPLVAIVGDITFYHDMNGLLAIRRCGVPVTIVLLNNDGGGIFNRLPVRDYEPAFTEYFITPHGLDFSHAAALYGLNFVSAGDRETFGIALTDSIAAQRDGISTIIEVRTDSRVDEAERQALIQAVRSAL